MPRGFSLYCLRSEGKSWSVLGVCKRCAVTLAALGSQSRSSTAPSRPDAPTKLNLAAVCFYPSLPPPTLDRVIAVNLERIARANLKELADSRIDDVLSFIDR